MAALNLAALSQDSKVRTPFLTDKINKKGKPQWLLSVYQGVLTVIHRLLSTLSFYVIRLKKLHNSPLVLS